MEGLFGRRELFKRAGALSVALLFPACEAASEYSQINLSQIIDNPSKYLGRKVATKGFAEHIKTERHLEERFIYDELLRLWHWQAYEKTLTVHALHEEPFKESRALLTAEEGGAPWIPTGFYIPDFGNYRLYGEFAVAGPVRKDPANNFYIDVFHVQNLNKK